MWPTIDVEALAVRTNNPVCGAFRGFGANQAQFAAEGLIDRLADAAGLSRWEMRRRNAVTPGATWGPGQVMDDGCLGAIDCLDAVKPAWDEAVAARARPWAWAWGSRTRASATGSSRWPRPSCGSRTTARSRSATAGPRWARASTRSPSRWRSRSWAWPPSASGCVVDTTRELGAGQTTGSRGTLMAAGSVRAACRAACDAGCAPGVDYEGEYRVDWTQALGTVEHPTIHSAFGYAAQLVVMDRETGAIERVLAAHDVGRVMNPLLCEGQVVGCRPHGPRATPCPRTSPPTTRPSPST